MFCVGKKYPDEQQSVLFCDVVHASPVTYASDPKLVASSIMMARNCICEICMMLGNKIAAKATNSKFKVSTTHRKIFEAGPPVRSSRDGEQQQMVKEIIL